MRRKLRESLISSRFARLVDFPRCARSWRRGRRLRQHAAETRCRRECRERSALRDHLSRSPLGSEHEIRFERHDRVDARILRAAHRRNTLHERLGQLTVVGAADERMTVAGSARASVSLGTSGTTRLGANGKWECTAAVVVDDEALVRIPQFSAKEQLSSVAGFAGSCSSDSLGGGGAGGPPSACTPMRARAAARPHLIVTGLCLRDTGDDVRSLVLEQSIREKSCILEGMPSRHTGGHSSRRFRAQSLVARCRSMRKHAASAIAKANTETTREGSSHGEPRA